MCDAFVIWRLRRAQATKPPPLSGTRVAVVTRVVDGDTIEVKLGAVRPRLLTVRLNGINCPETHPAGLNGKTRGTAAARLLELEQEVGIRARAHMEALAPAGTALQLTFNARQTDPHGRALADARQWTWCGVANETLSQQMLDARLALPYDGGAKPPFNPHDYCVK